MRTEIVDLGRRFVEIGDEEVADDDLRVRRLLGQSVGLGWDEVLERPRVVLLAEAGSGKTTEMRATAARLRAAGETSVFLPLEALRDDRVEDLVSSEEATAIAAWRASGEGPAWFFLDAVDELKLRGGTLQAALRRVRRALSHALDRARIVVSCRPSDWAAFSDLADLRDLLPTLPEKPGAASKPPMRVRLLPLDEEAIRRLARSQGVDVPAPLIDELRRADAVDFALRPLDAARMIEAWKRTGHLGTRSGQMEQEVGAAIEAAPKQRATADADPAALRRAAERLAFALVATRSLHVRVPEGEPEHSDAVEPTSVLLDLGPAAVGSLLRCALFDPATYGRIRFRHRSVLEYLAACHLHRRLTGGPRRVAIERLLFVRRYGHEVVPVHLRPVAAWLALWDDRVRRRLQAVEPQTLLEGGDPESLRRDAKVELLRAFVALHGEGDWRGMETSAREVARLAEPGLAEEVRTLWRNRGTNPEVADLLLDVMWAGRMTQCRDLMVEAAWDDGPAIGNRLIAVAGLGACGAVEELRAIAADMIVRPSAWPAWLVFRALAVLYPAAVDEEGLVRLVELHAGRSRDHVGLELSLEGIAEGVDPVTPAAGRLQARLLRLHEREAAGSAFHNRQSAHPEVGPALATLCRRILEARPGGASPEVLRTGLVLHRMDRWGHRDHRALDALQAALRTTPDRRRALYLQEVTHLRDGGRAKDPWEVKNLLRSTPAWPAEEDVPWLLRIMREDSDAFARAVGAEVLLDPQRDRDDPIWGELDQAAGGDEGLVALIRERRHLPPRPAEWLEMEARVEQERARHAEEEAERDAGWSRWRQDARDNPSTLFSGAHAETHLWNLIRDLRKGDAFRNYGVWSEEDVARRFGPEAAACAGDALRGLWRRLRPEVEAMQPLPDTTTGDEILCLNGAMAEAERPGWAAGLAEEEFRFAVRIAERELNGLPAFLDDLARHDPDAAASVILDEIRREVARDPPGHPRWLAGVLQRRGGATVAAVRPGAEAMLHERSVEDMSSSSLEMLLALTLKAEPNDRGRLTARCAERIAADPSAHAAGLWLRALAQLDPARAADALKALPLGTEAERDVGAALIRTAFDRHHGRFAADPPPDALAVRRLVALAYRAVRPEDDIHHEGTYTPDARDEAQEARGALLSRLIEMPGPEAARELCILAADPAVAHLRSRLPHLARERAAADAAEPRWSVGGVQAFEDHGGVVPRTPDEMLALVRDALDEVRHDLEHDDFSLRDALIAAPSEAGQQVILADQLRAKVRGLATVHREEQVKDDKRPDIRLTAGPGLRGAVEVKVADSWSWAELLEALRDQLVGRYLRHEGCRAGVLLLTHVAKKHWILPDRSRASFAELCRRLEAEAKVIERDAPDIRVTVVGFDLGAGALRTASEAFQ